MKLINYLGILILLYLPLYIFSESQSQDLVKWTESFGRMSLVEAKGKCSSMKMKLPTRSEWKSAKANTMTDSWKKDEIDFWTSDGYSDEYGFDFDLNSGTSGYYESKGILKQVRCISASNQIKAETPVSKTIAGKWSSYLGQMKWEDAKNKCASIGMRLPTREEAINAFKSGETKAWESDGDGHWTSDEFTKGSAYYIVVASGFASHYGASEDLGHVRCIK